MEEKRIRSGTGREKNQEWDRAQSPWGVGCPKGGKLIASKGFGLSCRLRFS